MLLYDDDNNCNEKGDNKRERGNIQEKWGMHSIIAHHLLASAQSILEQ